MSAKIFISAKDGIAAPFSQLIIVLLPIFIRLAAYSCVNLAFTRAAAKLI